MEVSSQDADCDPLPLYLSRLFVPAGDEVLAADPSPESRQWLKAHVGARPIRFVDRASLLARLKDQHGAAVLDRAVFGLGRRFPELSAQTVITRQQMIVLGLVLATTLAALAFWPVATARVIVTLLTLAFAASGIFRVVLALLAVRHRPIAGGEVGALPTYTILVPLYREAGVIAELMQGLSALDYPRHLLDIKLVMEADDRETIAVARAVLGDDAGPFEIVEVPAGGPRTKPKAANYALAFARGEYLVVYDAEDRPEPDQLKKAIATFRASPRTTACLQARLNFYNADHNWLTRGIMAQTPQAI